MKTPSTTPHDPRCVGTWPGGRPFHVRDCPSAVATSAPAPYRVASLVDDVLDAGLTGAALGALNYLRLPHAWAERVVEHKRPPRWQIAGGRTFGQATFDALWRGGFVRDTWDREGHSIIVAAYLPAAPSDRTGSAS